MSAHSGGLTRIVAVVDGDRKTISELVNKAAEKPDIWELKINKERKRRSLDANAYYWSLIDKLARALQTSKDELHEKMIEDYGSFKQRKDGGIAVFSIQADRDPHEITAYSKLIGRGYVGEKEFIHYAVLKGSSEMNSEEFSSLLDGLIFECKEQQIETLPTEEINKMKALLGGEDD